MVGFPLSSVKETLKQADPVPAQRSITEKAREHASLQAFEQWWNNFAVIAMVSQKLLLL